MVTACKEYPGKALGLSFEDMTRLHGAVFEETTEEEGHRFSVAA